MKHTVTVIGSGNWGTAIAKLLAENVKKREDFNETIYMWTFEEKIEGRNITEIINNEHENVKYLKGVKLPKNVYAEPNLLKCVKECNILVFVVPHQFIKNVINQIKDIVTKNNKTYIAVSLIKGALFENNELVLISEYISKSLNIECAVLMGANIANQVAEGCISEGTLASKEKHNSKILLRLFNCYTYRVSFIDDIYGVELCGTLKNIVSIAYGIGMGKKYPTNTTVAILRNGIKEMKKFIEMFYRCNVNTFFESSGIADTFVSCISGRNFNCGMEMSRNDKKIEDIENEMDGQKLQGTLTSKEIYQFLLSRGKVDEFPLFTMVYRICYENEFCDSILEVISYEVGSNI